MSTDNSNYSQLLQDQTRSYTDCILNAANRESYIYLYHLQTTI